MEKLKKYQPLMEMAKVGIINDLTIEVYTDHNPPHFHVTKKDKFEARMDIKTLDVISYKWQKGNSEISASEINKISKWLDKKYPGKDITNKDLIGIFWKSMNN
jgi:hypothetical protein